MDRTVPRISTIETFAVLLSLLVGIVSAQPSPGLQFKPIITFPPEDVFSVEGVLEFTCRADGSPKPTIDWYNATSGKRLTDQVPSSGSTLGIHLNRHYGQLMISNPQHETTYSVYCNASNEVGWTVSSPPVHGGLAFIRKTFPKSPVDQTVYVGDRVVLDCVPPHAFPLPKVVWLKDDRVLGPKSPLRDTSLTIEKASTRDAGSYACRATNAAGSETSNPGLVVVERRAYFVEMPNDLRVRRGQSAEFRCKAGDDRLVQWRRGPGEGHIDTSRAKLTDGRLLLLDVQPSDAGLYVCADQSGLTADALLTVESSPAFTQTPDDTTVRQGETAMLDCFVTGFPKPSIYWELPDKTPVFPDELGNRGGDRVYVHGDGRLEIANAQPHDAGKYQCAAYSSVDRIHSSAVLTVIPADEPVTTTVKDAHILAPIIGLPPANQTHGFGDLVTLDCELSVSLPPSHWSVSWYRRSTPSSNPVPIDFTSTSLRYGLLPGGGLQILDADLSDSGDYTCVASSDYFPSLNSNWTAVLKITATGQTRPVDNPLSPPRNLRVTNVTSSTVTLAWESSNTSVSRSQLAYWVEYYRSDRPNEGWVVVERNWPANTVQIHGLDSATPYYFLIRPRWGSSGRVGWASAPLGPIRTLVRPNRDQSSSEIQFKTRKISDVSVFALSSGLVRVSWAYHPTKEHYPVSGFKVGYVQLPLARCLDSALKRPPQGHFISDQLTSAGSNVFCSLNLLSSKQSALDTMHRLQGPLNSSVQFIDVPIRSMLSKHNKRRFAQNNWSTLLRDLEPFSCYEVGIQAYTSEPVFGQPDDESAGHTVLTFEDIPNSAPEQIYARSLSDTDVEVNWRPPPSNNWNGLLVGYRTYLHDQQRGTYQIFNVSFEETRLVLRNLDPASDYSIKLACVNCKGDGVRSQPLNLLTRFRRSNLGVGWGYDPASGRPLSGDANGLHPVLIHQPWFIATIVASLLAWSLVISLVVYCCCCCNKHRKERLGQKNSNANNKSLLTSNDQYGKPDSSQSLVYLQPLLVKAQSPGELSTNHVTNPPGYYHNGGAPVNYRSSMATLPHPPTYTEYAVSTAAYPTGNAATASHPPAIYQHPQNGFFETSRKSDIYASPEMDACVAETTTSYTIAYPTLGQSQVSNTRPLTVYPNGYGHSHSTGLPPVAPVAQIGNLQHPPTSGYFPDASGRSSPSVTPYAIASIVHTSPAAENGQALQVGVVRHQETGKSKRMGLGSIPNGNNRRPNFDDAVSRSISNKSESSASTSGSSSGNRMGRAKQHLAMVGAPQWNRSICEQGTVQFPQNGIPPPPDSPPPPAPPQGQMRSRSSASSSTSGSVQGQRGESLPEQRESVYDQSADTTDDDDDARSSALPCLDQGQAVPHLCYTSNRQTSDEVNRGGQRVSTYTPVY